MNTHKPAEGARQASVSATPRSNESATQMLGEFVAGLRYEDLPDDVRERAKLAVIDWVGAALAGRDSESGAKVAALLEELGGPEEATVIGRRRARPALHAAFLNAVQASVYEVDDVHLDCRVHPGLPVISAAFALAEREGCSGRRLIEAVVAGYEVIVRLAIALGVPHNDFWHSTGTAGAVAAAAAAAKVLGLEPRETAGALGLGATQGAGLIEGTEGKALTVKHFHGAKAAQNGIWAAFLARRDFLGSPEALEAEWGFLRAFAKGTEADRDALTAGLGSRWYILRTISKPFPCCLSAHAAIHAALGLAAKHDVSVDAVESVEAYVNPASYYMIKNADPRDELQAKFSLPFCVAVALIDREVGPRAFESEKLWDTGVRDLMQRVKLEANHEIGRIQSLVRVRTRDGRMLERMAERESLNEAQVLEKFRGLVKSIVTAARADEIIRTIENLEAQENARSVGAVLGPTA